MRNVRNLVIIGVVIAVIIAGAVAYAVLRPPATASGPIQAIPLAATPGSVSATSEAAQPTDAPSAAATAAATTSAETEATSAPASATAESGDTAATAAAGATTGAIAAQIVPGESEVRFIIDEVLNNAPFTVVGTTDQVAGEMSINPTNPSQSQIGVIQVNARTLATDSQFRDRAIKNRILFTDQYEFITFTPTELKGLPESASIGQSYTFQIVGDLTIRDITKPVTFDVTATPVSEGRLEGLAQTTIRYADYDITIPQVPQVASVDEDVRLEIEFVAVPKQ